MPSERTPITAGQRVTYCREASCGAPIVFARTPQGKVMPVDIEPRDDGNVFVHRDVHGILVCRVQSKEHPDPAAFEKRTVHHRVTCAAHQPTQTALDIDLPSNVIPLRRNR